MSLFDRERVNSKDLTSGKKVDIICVVGQHSKTTAAEGYQLRLASPEHVTLISDAEPTDPTASASKLFTKETLDKYGAKLIPEVLKLPKDTETTVIGVATYDSYGGNKIFIQDIVNDEIVGYLLFGPSDPVEIGDIVYILFKPVA